MFGIGGSEFVVIIFVALLIFGPAKIPEIARVIKRGYQEWNKVKSQVDSTISDIKQEIDLKTHLEDGPPKIKTAPASAPQGESHDSTTAQSESASLAVPEHDDYLTAETDQLYPDQEPVSEPNDDPGDQN